MKKLLIILLTAVLLLNVMPAAVSARDNPFDDVPAGKWYTSAVLWCYERGYMAGESENTFSPNKGMTRAMIVTLFAAVSGDDLKTGEYEHGGFDDVPDGKWYTRPVSWAAKNGITSGTGNGRFSPNDTITREQFVTMLRKLLEYKGVNVEYKGSNAINAFGDLGTASGWARTALAWAAENKLISGTGTVEGRPYLSPKGTVTRAQAAVFIKGALEKNIGGEYPVGSLTLGGTDISDFVIIYGDDFTVKMHESNKTAAEFLAAEIKNVCGVTLPVYKDSERRAYEGAYEILVGITDREALGFVTVDRDFSKPAYIYEMKGNYLIFTCPVDLYGTSMAVSRFLEEVCGATYLGDGMFDRTSMKSAELADGVRVAVECRYENVVVFTGVGDDYFLGTPNGDEIVLNLSHSLPVLGCPGCEYGDTPSSGHHIAHVLSRDPCLSEPDSIDIIINNVKYILQDKLGDNKTAAVQIHVSQSDSAKYCECQHCRDVYRVWGMGATYTQIMTYVWNAIKDEYPNVRLIAYGCDQTGQRPKLADEVSDEKYEAFLAKYGDLKYVPAKDITPPDNCILWLKSDVVCESHTMNDPDCPRNKAYLKNVAGWCQMYKTIYHNSFTGSKSSHYNVFPDIYELRDTFSFFAGIENYKGCREFFFDPYDLYGLREFLISRLIWDPFMSEKEYSSYIDTFLKNAYGPGETFIREYIDKMEELSSANHFWTYNGTGDRWDSILTRGQWDDNYGYLSGLYERALSLCDTEEQIYNVRRSFVSLKYIGCRMAYACYAESGSQDDLSAFSALSTAFYNEVRELGLRYPENWTDTLDPELWDE